MRETPHRVGVADGKRLPRARLSVGQHGSVVPLEAPLDEGQGGPPVHLLLGGVRPEDVVELAAAAVARNGDLVARRGCSLTSQFDADA